MAGRAAALEPTRGQQPARAADESRKTQTSGLGLSLGLGTQYPVFGGQVMYYLQLPDTLLRVAPYASLGLLSVGTAGGSNLGAAFGAIASWGDKHRLLLDAAYATVGLVSLNPHGRELDSRGVWGPKLELGYEYMAFSGWFFRFGVGAVYMTSQPLFSPRKRLGLALTLFGVGFKLW